MKHFRKIAVSGFHVAVLIAASIILYQIPVLRADNPGCCGDPSQGCSIVYQWPCGAGNGCYSQCCSSSMSC